MDRITSSQVSDLMEAYAAVYAPQEITEEQVWEEVESWVNSLVEEGYDLSEYTWEDMYDAYIEEQGRGRVTGSNPNVWRPTTTNSGPAGGGMGGRRGGGSSPGSIKPAATKPAPAPAARPAAPAPAARPAAPAPAARPAAPAPKAAPTAPSIERRIPTSAELRQAQQLRTTGSNLSGTGALAPKPTAPAATPAPAPAPAPTATPKPNLQQSIRNRRLNMDLDLFDVIKGHLLDEGYADTEEAALKIMANMSEEWKQSIVDEGFKEIDREKHGRMYNRYKKLRTAAMKDARETGEASGENRRKMGRMGDVIDKSAENLRNKG